MSRENNQMAYIAEITHLVPIRDADAIEKAVINAGWPVVVKKGEFNVGDLVVYFEIDSWVPTEIAPFLSKGKEPREYNGVKGEKLRNIKLRGCRSQGLVLPLSILGCGSGYDEPADFSPMQFVLGTLVGDYLGVQKWEAPEGFSSGNSKGNFPSAVPKTDAERIQNLRRDLEEWVERGLTFEATEKLHGTSFTCLQVDGEFGVCSRNLLLQEGDGTYWSVAVKNGLKEKMAALGRNIAIQGEIIGPGICGNQYGMVEPTLFVFNVFDIDKKQYLDKDSRIEIVNQLGLPHAPIFMYNLKIDVDSTSRPDAGIKVLAVTDGNIIEAVLKFAEGKSVINGSEREGLVFKCIEDPSIQFKAVSNVWLDKEK